MIVFISCIGILGSPEPVHTSISDNGNSTRNLSNALGFIATILAFNANTKPKYKQCVCVCVCMKRHKKQVFLV